MYLPVFMLVCYLKIWYNQCVLNAPHEASADSETVFGQSAPYTAEGCITPSDVGLILH